MGKIQYIGLIPYFATLVGGSIPSNLNGTTNKVPNFQQKKMKSDHKYYSNTQSSSLFEDG